MTSQCRQVRSWRTFETTTPEEELLRAQYRVLRTIGEGGFASIHLAKHLPTDSLVAVKTIDKRQCPSFDTELDIFKSVEHPNIVKLYQVVESDYRLHLVMEYLDGGDLVDYVQKMVRLGEEEAKDLFGQILKAVKYCHDHGITHRDLKAENILLDKGTAKLCDFGLSVRLQPQQELTEQCGTPAYWAPEMVKQQRYLGPKVDVWSLGVLLYFMVMGDVPYEDSSWAVFKKQVLAGRFTTPKYFSPELKGILNYMMTANPQQRPTVWQIMRHPWFRGAKVPSPPPIQNVLAKPDPAILYIMASYLGFNPDQVSQALPNCMATYRILKQLQDQGQHHLARRMRYAIPGPPPCPSPACKSCRALHLKKSSAPVRHRAAGFPAKEQMKGGGRKGRRTVCLPCILWRTPVTNTEEDVKATGNPSITVAAAITATTAAAAATAAAVVIAAAAVAAAAEAAATAAAVVAAAAAAAAAATAAAAAVTAAAAAPTVTMDQPTEMSSPATEQEVGSRPNSLPPVLHNTWVPVEDKRKISSTVPCPTASYPSQQDPQEESSELPPGPVLSETPETSFPSVQPTSPRNEQRRGWRRLRRWKKNITTCFQSLSCCCRPNVH
ncbi:sperm motility kinase 4A-like [Dipodomys merriami]|uniref:sperm motility kinase 4A-like n=1 Tax=Dipodomys merriami TaxID=94247 RepID=UPI003855C81A